MQRRFLRCFAPEVEVLPEPPKPPRPEDYYEGPPTTRRGTPLCFHCGRLLYRNNKSHICTDCQRKWGLPTLRRRVKPLQEWHRNNCHDKNCKDPAHWANCIPVRPRRPKRPSRSKRNAQGASQSGAISHSVLLDEITAFRLAERSSAKSAQEGCRIAKTDLIRQAIEEFLENHPDSEYFIDAVRERESVG